MLQLQKKEDSCRQSSDIDGHLERFTPGKYPWKRFFIVNFSLIQKEPVLPSNSRYHDRVFTFVYSTNTLYRGANVRSSEFRVPSSNVKGNKSSEAPVVEYSICLLHRLDLSTTLF